MEITLSDPPDRHKLSHNLPRFLVYLVIAGACWLGWASFVVHLDYESMWMDEDYTWSISREGPFSLVQRTALDVHPPAYYLWVWGWMQWTGSENLFVMRLSSAITALLAVAVCYRLGQEWFRSRWAGLAAALFLGTSSFFVYYARDLRMYPLTVLLVCMSWWFLGRLLKSKPHAVLGYAATLGLMAYTYYFTAFFIVAQIVFVALYHRDKWRPVLKAFGLAFVAFLPWLPVFLRQIVTAKAQSGTTSGPVIGKFLGTVSTSPDSINAFINTYTAQQPAFILLLIVLALLLGLRSDVTARYRRWLVAAAMWFFLSAVLFFAINLVIPIYGLRYTLPVVPGLALLAGAVVPRLNGQWTRLGMVGVIGVSGVLWQARAFPSPKPPHRELLETVARRYRPGDKIWYNLNYGALGSSLDMEVGYYLKVVTPQLSPDMFVWAAPADYQDIKAVPRVWDIRPYWIPIPASAAADLTNGRVISEAYVFDAYTVHLYEAPPPPETAVSLGDWFQVSTSGTDRAAYHPGDTALVKTWWTVQQTPKLDYSYGLYLCAAGSGPSAPIAQADAGLVLNDKPTSQWTAADSTLLALEFSLPPNLAPGRYQLWLGVYYWQAPTRLAVQGNDASMVDTKLSLMRVAQFSVEK